MVMQDGFCICICGQVQGVGYWFFVWQFVLWFGIMGIVLNDLEGVFIYVCGDILVVFVDVLEV